MFEPKLSILKQKAIQYLSIGSVDKLFLEFETQWWPASKDNWKGIHILWTIEELQNLNVNIVIPYGLCVFDTINSIIATLSAYK